MASGLLERDDLLLETAESLCRPRKAVQKRWSDKAKAKAAEEEVRRFVAERIEPFLCAHREYLYDLSLEVLLPLLERYRQVRKAEGRLSYQDLLFECAALLRENGRARAYFQQQYKVLLVDEFQDVDPLMVEVLFFLCGEQVNERDWRKMRLRPGSLFAVGDPKQSIYRFRRADMEIYHQVRAKLAAEGSVLQLTESFRCVAPLADFVNEAFRSIFPASLTAEQAPFAPMNTSAPRGTDAPRGTEVPARLGVQTLELEKVERNEPLAIAIQDAERIAGLISSWLGQPPEGYSPTDFLILTERKTHLDLYAAALERRGIPAAISGLTAMERLREIEEWMKLLRLLVDPLDDVRLLSVLRGLFFGCSDQELHEHVKCAGALSFNPQPDAATGAPSHGRVAAALAELQAFWNIWRSQPVDSAIEEIMERCGLLAISTADPRLGHCLAVLERLLESARQAALGGVSPTEAVEQLERLAGSEFDLSSAAAGGAVRLMNAHKAKGLEARVVVLACSVSDRGFGPQVHVRRGETGSRGYFVLSGEEGEHAEKVFACAPGWRDIGRREEEFLAAERMRLLYVAATRARESLVISRYPDKPEKSPWRFFDPALLRLSGASGKAGSGSKTR